MLKGLTKAGLGMIESDELFIRKAAEYGFHAVDLDPLELLNQYGEQTAKRLLEDCGITLGAFTMPVVWWATDEDFRSGLKRLVAATEAARLLGCDKAITFILPSTDQESARFMALATRRLRICANILEAYGIRLGLEFVGPHHLRTTWKNPFIWGLKETLEWIDTIGSANTGLLLDAYHWYTNELGIQDILNLRPEQIVHVHINDAPDVPVNEVADNKRLYPGEGVIDLHGFLGALVHIGYKGVISQEVLTAEAPSQPFEQLMKRSKAGFDRVFPVSYIAKEQELSK